MLDTGLSTVKDFLETYQLALTALALIGYTISVRKLTAFNVACGGLLLINILHIHIASVLAPLFQDPDLKTFIYYFWYLAFAATDLLFVYITKSVISRFGLIKDRASAYVLMAYVVLAFVQIARLSLRELGIDGLGFLYSNAIISINISMTIIVCAMALRSIVVRSGQVSISSGA